MRDWPENNQTIDLEDAIKPLELFLEGHDDWRDYRESCYRLIKPVSHVAVQPDELLEESINSSREMNRAALTVAFQLGVCQGYRMRIKDQRHANLLIDVVQDDLASGRVEQAIESLNRLVCYLEI